MRHAVASLARSLNPGSVFSAAAAAWPPLAHLTARRSACTARPSLGHAPAGHETHSNVDPRPLRRIIIDGWHPAPARARRQLRASQGQGATRLLDRVGRVQQAVAQVGHASPPRGAHRQVQVVDQHARGGGVAGVVVPGGTGVGRGGGGGGGAGTGRGEEAGWVRVCERVWNGGGGRWGAGGTGEACQWGCWLWARHATHSFTSNIRYVSTCTWLGRNSSSCSHRSHGGGEQHCTARSTCLGGSQAGPCSDNACQRGDGRHMGSAPRRAALRCTALARAPTRRA